ncbi:hypothetical protein [Brevibacterium renqingii]|uniref:hypothetical protein n=1 Tax=Brevibacterium renqingii TaxID=2776916 RepID=UPI001ADF0D4E|nr:hypothetical protein [Brevibacterium renqingii]
MSATPNDTAGAAHGETPRTAPAALDDTGLSITLLAFVVFIPAWIGAKLTAFSVPVDGAGGTDLSLLQLALFLLAGAAAIVVGRSLRPVPRSVFIVITICYSVFSGLTPLAALTGGTRDVGFPLFSALTLFVFLADLLYPLVVAAVLAATVSQVSPATDEAAGPEIERKRSAVRRSGLLSAFALLAAAIVTVGVWLLRQSAPGLSVLWSSGDVINALAAVAGTIAAVFALRCVAVSRSLPRPEPVVGPRRAHPRLARALTFFTLAGGLHLCLTSTAIAAGFPVELGTGFMTWVLHACAFTIGGFALGIVTLDAVKSRSVKSRSVKSPAVQD